MRTVLLKLAIGAALVLGGTGLATAMDVQPTINVIQLPRDGAGIRIAIRNPRKVALPVTFEMVERSINPDGTEVHTPADGMFAIFPAQATIQPGRMQTVRVQWLGAQAPKSRSFTMFATELPVDLTESDQSGVKRILRMGVSIHVASATARPQPVLEASSTGKDGTKVVIRNDGDRFVYVDALSLAFGDKKFEGAALGNLAGRTLIPPGARREFVVPGVKGQPTLKLVGPLL